jgi:thioesterase domain-containing protein
MAAQLEQSGAHVDRVILIDCPAPRVHTPADAFTKLRWFFEDLNMGLPTEVLTDTWLSALPDEQRFGQTVALMNKRVQGALDEGQLFQIFRAFDAIVDAVLRYRPQAIRADLLVLRATDGSVSEFAGHPHTQEPDWGWLGLTSGALTCDRVVGSHHTVLRKPGVDAIANWLAPASHQQEAEQDTCAGTVGLTSA